jgi:hypothetical protein
MLKMSDGEEDKCAINACTGTQEFARVVGVAKSGKLSRFDVATPRAVCEEEPEVWPYT